MKNSKYTRFSVGRDVSIRFSLSGFVCLFVFCFCLFKAAPEAYGGSRARVQIRAVAAGLHHSHSNVRTEPYLRSTPQLMAMLDL